MTLSARGKVAKKFALYPPKKMMDALGLREGQPVKYEVEKGKLVVEPLPDPLELALSGRKWAKTSVREFERQSEQEQQELYG